MTAEIEAVDCSCGTRMHYASSPERGGLYVCMNCDGVQKQESGMNPRDRIRTQADRAYNTAINTKCSVWYPKKGGKK